MDNVEQLQKELKSSRNELKNIRQELCKLKLVQKKEIDFIKQNLHSNDQTTKNLNGFEEESGSPCQSFDLKPIGYIESCFKTKNATPRQSSLCPQAKALLKISKEVFTNPDHSLQALEEFSHIWIIFMFHKNGQVKCPKAKVHPPRLNGSAVGVFSTRSPHRPNPIGLSLSKLERIEGNTIYLSGIDLLDGTPVLDLKPYIPSYDAPCVEQCDSKNSSRCRREHPENMSLRKVKSKRSTNNQGTLNICSTASKDSDGQDSGQLGTLHAECTSLIKQNTRGTTIPLDGTITDNVCKNRVGEQDDDNEYDMQQVIRTARWLNGPPVTPLEVVFSGRAKTDVRNFHSRTEEHTVGCEYCLSSMRGPVEMKNFVTVLLQNDPRSVYRRKKCRDRLYYCFFDSVHITSWFDETVPLVEVLRVQPLSKLSSVCEMKD